MIVPTLERSVQEQPALLQPTPVSGAVPGAFGEKTAEATADMGKAIASVGSLSAQLVAHMQRQHVEQSKDQGKEYANKYLKYSNELLHSPAEIEIQHENGDTEKRVAGELNNLGIEAKGGYSNYQQRAFVQRKAIEQGLEGNPVALKAFREHADNIDNIHGNTVLEHEASQLRAYSTAVSVSTIENLVNESAMASSPLLLSGTVYNIDKEINELGRKMGYPPEKMKELRDEKLDKVFTTAITAELNRSGAAGAKSLIDGVKGLQGEDKLIPKYIYEKAEKDLYVLDAQNAEKQLKAQKAQLVQGEMNTFTQLANGMPMSAINPGDEVRAGRMRQETADVFNQYRNSIKTTEVRDIAGDDNRKIAELEATAVTLNQIFNSGSPEEINKYLTEMLRGGADGKISKESIAVVIKVASMRSGKLGTIEEQTAVDAPTAGYRLIGNWAKENSIPAEGITSVITDYGRLLAEGKAAQEAVQGATRNYIEQIYPKAAQMTNEQVQNLTFVSPNNTSRIVIEKNSKTKPARMWGGKEERFK